MNNWYSLPAEEVLKQLNSSYDGLTQEETANRLARFGPNKLPEHKGKSGFAIFFEQFKSPLIYVLLAADVIVFALKEYIDGFIILFILFFNAVLGAIQEGRAQNTLAKLSQFAETRAEVKRGGQELNIPDAEVVTGDIILLQEGEKIPADGRIIYAASLETQEAALTGESEPVRKTEAPLTGELPTAEQKNMVFKGTTVASGTGTAVVTATGPSTIIGKISAAISGINTEIPLTKNLRQLSKVVVIIVSIIIAFIFAAGIAEGKDFKEMFLAAIAISVAAVPEGLPLVLTVTLSAGVWRMAKRRVLVKKLQAVEALGQAKNIAVDKTGTITKNELVVQKVVAAENKYDIPGVGYEPKPSILKPAPDLALIAQIAALCANARIVATEEGGYRLIGDPTEGALSAFASKAGYPKDELLKAGKLITDWPFDYQKKFHLALYEKDSKLFLAMTGAPEVIIENCSFYLSEGRAKPFDAQAKERLLSEFNALSGEGLRVIAGAFNPETTRGVSPDKLPALTFGGLIAMRDALRDGIKENITRAKDLGIRVIMITGDHAVTAKTIAEQAGIYTEGDTIITGGELEKMADDEFAAALNKTTVFARVTPEHKMKIIGAYRKRDEIIAMTGDGVNDAPSLVAADLGIAMGKIGTEVAKEASDLVLMDDNFGDILSAIEEGRNLRQGLRRTITYLFSSNLGELLMIIFSLLADLPLPLIAAQIIWMNVVTDTFFDISLALERKDPTLMRAGAHIAKKLFDKLTVVRLSVIAPVISISGFWLFQNHTGDLDRARTLALTSLIVFQWFNSLNCRSETKSIFRMNPFSNKFLLATLVGVMSLHLFAVYNPILNKILRIEPLYGSDWLTLISLGLLVVLAEEIRKFFYRRRLKIA